MPRQPHACFLLPRGLETLVLRVRHQSQSTLELAGDLVRHPRVAQLNDPGLDRHPHHARAREWLAGMGRAELRADRRVSAEINAPSLGGLETLITRPAQTSHAGLPAESRRRQGSPTAWSGCRSASSRRRT